MNIDRNTWRLYLATDDRRHTRNRLVQAVADAVDGGVTCVQLRLKTATAGEIFETARRMLEITRDRGVPLIINDRVDIMLATGADGVHVGREDLPLREVRRLAGDRIVGYSVNAPDHLAHAEANGADYVGVGPVFATGTKSDTGPVLGVDGLARIVSEARIPCVAIGGITEATLPRVLQTGVAGVCVVSAILGQASPGRAAAGLAARLL